MYFCKIVTTFSAIANSSFKLGVAVMVDVAGIFERTVTVACKTPVFAKKETEAGVNKKALLVSVKVTTRLLLGVAESVTFNV